MGSNEIRRTSDKIVESQSDKTAQAKSQASDSKNHAEKLREHMGPGFAGLFVKALGVMAAFQGLGGAEGSMPEAHSTALTQRDSGSDKAISLPPALPDLRAEIIGKSPIEPYVPAPRPEWFAPYQGPTVKDIWRNAYKEYVEGVEAPDGLHQGEAQNAHDGETSSGQAKPDKNKARKLLSSHEEKIATMRALMDEAKENPELLQSFKKRLDGKKVRALREQLLLEGNPGSARRRLYPDGDYTYTQLTPIKAQDQLQHTQAFQDATQYLGKQPSWNNTYAYQEMLHGNETGIVAIYPPEGYSMTFIAIDNPSASNDAIGLLGQFVVQSNETASITWSTPQGKPFVAWLMQRWSDKHDPYEVLVSGDINWRNFTFSPACFMHNMLTTNGGFSDNCMNNCIESLFKNQSSCYYDCVFDNVAVGIDAAKQCIATNSGDGYECLTFSGVDPAVQPWPYMIKISGEVYVQNNCPGTVNMWDVDVSFNYVCPPRTCPPGRAYYSLDYYKYPTGGIVLTPGDSASFLNYETWVYCSTFNETEKVNYISLPTTIDVNFFGNGVIEANSDLVYSPNKNFHVYDASMYPDLNPYPAIPSTCGENDPDCTQLCARHPDANLPSDTIPAQYPESPPKAHARASALVWEIVGGGAIGVTALTAAWSCYRKCKKPGSSYPVIHPSMPDHLPNANSSYPVIHPSMPDHLPSERMGYRPLRSRGA